MYNSINSEMRKCLFAKPIAFKIKLEGVQNILMMTIHNSFCRIPLVTFPIVLSTYWQTETHARSGNNMSFVNVFGEANNSINDSLLQNSKMRTHRYRHARWWRWTKDQWTKYSNKHLLYSVPNSSLKALLFKPWPTQLQQFRTLGISKGAAIKTLFCILLIILMHWCLTSSPTLPNRFISGMKKWGRYLEDYPRAYTKAFEHCLPDFPKFDLLVGSLHRPTSW